MVYDYYYADGLLVRQTWGSNYIDFLYDESGVFSFVYNGTQYFYIKNLQGDVVAIANAEGTIIVEYAYDAWGAVISVTGTEAATIGAVNPIRYRGYYYDTDTGFYYLQSRYYDPAIRRFINADIYVSTGQGFIGYNMYAYCGNNPVSRIDVSGYFWAEVLDAFAKYISQSSGTFAVAGVISQVDSPMIGPADVAAAAVAGSAVIVCFGVAIYDTISVAVSSTSIPRTEVKEEEKDIVISKAANAVYYGCSIDISGNLVYLTGPMDFSSAHSWAMSFQTTTRNNWGLYTPNAEDALVMASALCTYAEPLHHPNHGMGFY